MRVSRHYDRADEDAVGSIPKRLVVVEVVIAVEGVLETLLRSNAAGVRRATLVKSNPSSTVMPIIKASH